jgi:hypothetical protein
LNETTGSNEHSCKHREWHGGDCFGSTVKLLIPKNVDLIVPGKDPASHRPRLQSQEFSGGCDSP